MIRVCSIDSIPDRKRGRWTRDVEQFIESGAECAEVILDENDNLKLANDCLIMAARSPKFKMSVRVMRRSDRLFLIRNDAK